MNDHNATRMSPSRVLAIYVQRPTQKRPRAEILACRLFGSSGALPAHDPGRAGYAETSHAAIRLGAGGGHGPGWTRVAAPSASCWSSDSPSPPAVRSTNPSRTVPRVAVDRVEVDVDAELLSR